MSQGDTARNDSTQATFRQLIAHPPFRRLFAADAVSFTGDALSRVGLPILIFQETGSPLALGAAFAVLQIPWILVSGPAGVLADRRNRARLMTVSSLLESAALVLLLMFTHPAVLYICLAIAAVMQVVRATATQAALPEVVGVRMLPRAMATRVILVQSTDIAGLLLGGVAVAAIGSRGAIAVDASTFLVYALLVAPLRTIVAVRTSTQGSTDGDGSHPIAEAATFLWISPGLRFLSLFMGLRGLAFIGVLPLIVVFVEEDMQAMPALFAVFLVAGSIGVMLGSVIASRQRAMVSPSVYLVGGSGVAGVFMALMALTPNLPIAVVLFFLSMTAYSGGNLVTNVGVVQLAPPEMRGRVVGFTWALIKSGQVLGALGLGALASAIGVSSVMVVSGVSLAIVTSISSVLVTRETLAEINEATTQLS